MARPASGQAPKKGKKNRKYGRNATFCLHYKNEGRRERNKKRKLVRHLKKYPSDSCAKEALARI